MAERTKTCKSCKFYQHRHEPLADMPTGECRIVAPVGGAGDRGWPLVVLQDWCPQWDREGEFKFGEGGVSCTGCAWRHASDGTGSDAFDEHVCADHPVENLPEAESGE